MNATSWDGQSCMILIRRRRPLTNPSPSHCFLCSSHFSPGKVLVHSITGMSRSSTLVLAYLTLYHHISLHHALPKVVQKRAIYPNRNFLTLLLDLDLISVEMRICFGAQKAQLESWDCPFHSSNSSRFVGYPPFFPTLQMSAQSEMTFTFLLRNLQRFSNTDWIEPIDCSIVLSCPLLQGCFCGGVDRRTYDRHMDRSR